VRKRSASGLVNAVLRRIADVRSAPPLPPRPDAPVPAREAALDYLSVTWSHPRWLAARWLDRVDFAAAEARVRFNNATPPLMLRVNTLRVNRDAMIEKLAAEGIAATPARYAASGLRVTGGNPLRTPLAHTGLFALQDEASQLVADLVRATPGMRVLDTCASPGGKTTAIAAAMDGQGLIVAMDVSEPRVDLLRRTVAELGATAVRVIQGDAARGVPCHAVFDWVLVDAPCSGLGTIRRDPEIRWRREESDFARLAALQARLLAEAATAVRPGGYLVYATCSSEPEENERVVASVLASSGDLARIDARTLHLPDGAHDVIDADGYLRTTPEDHELELFFGAVLRRR
jgi:16S rRNA (cytosine967-C5)-methyltransferase